MQPSQKGGYEFEWALLHVVGDWCESHASCSVVSLMHDVRNVLMLGTCGPGFETPTTVLEKEKEN